MLGRLDEGSSAQFAASSSGLLFSIVPPAFRMGCAWDMCAADEGPDVDYDYAAR
jgi:hypothetical protein